MNILYKYQFISFLQITLILNVCAENFRLILFESLDLYMYFLMCIIINYLYRFDRFQSPYLIQFLLGVFELHEFLPFICHLYIFISSSLSIPDPLGTTFIHICSKLYGINVLTRLQHIEIRMYEMNATDKLYNPFGYSSFPCAYLFCIEFVAFMFHFHVMYMNVKHLKSNITVNLRSICTYL